jgi:hypothetical protein
MLVGLLLIAVAAARTDGAPTPAQWAAVMGENASFRAVIAPGRLVRASSCPSCA